MGLGRRFLFPVSASAGPYAADFLVVAGGGSGGTRRGSGGGAGGLRTSYGSTSGGGSSAETELTLTTGTTYTITVGNGGNVPPFSGTVYSQNGEKGEDSSITGSDITNIVSEGGGGGMSISGGSAPVYSLMSGGSGAGAGAQANTSPGLATTGQGYNGGNACLLGNGGYGGGGGGGGASSAGGSPSSCGAYANFASGGNGLAVSITGGSTTYSEGGDAPNKIQPSMPAAPTANTGSAGCGGSEYSHVNASYMPKAGADGIVILRVPTANYNSAGVVGAETPTTSGTDTIIKWHGDGSYTA